MLRIYFICSLFFFTFNISFLISLFAFFWGLLEYILLTYLSKLGWIVIKIIYFFYVEEIMYLFKVKILETLPNKQAEILLFSS
jgi:hypothetical protein